MAATAAAAEAQSMEVESTPSQQRQQEEKEQLVAADQAEPSAVIESEPSAHARVECIVNQLVAQREDDERMRQAMEMWAVRELEKEKALLKSLLMKESQARQQRRSSSSSADAATEDSELRTMFAPLYAHYRHLQTLLAKYGSGLKPQVPLFHSSSDSSTASLSSAASSATPHHSSAFSAVKPQHISPHTEKRALQVKLAEYTRQFTATHGRAIQSSEDIAAVKDDWARYKYLKFTLSEKGQSTAINQRVADRVNATSTPERTKPAAASSGRGHKRSVSLSTVPSVSAAVSPTAGFGSASPHSPQTPSTLPTQPNTPLTPSTPRTPVLGSAYPFASLYGPSIPQHSSPSLLSSLPSPSSSPAYSAMLPPSPVSPYSLAQSYPHSPYSPYSPMAGMSVGGSFNGYMATVFQQHLPYGAPVQPLHYNQPLYDGVALQPTYVPTAPGWC